MNISNFSRQLQQISIASDLAFDQTVKNVFQTLCLDPGNQYSVDEMISVYVESKFKELEILTMHSKELVPLLLTHPQLSQTGMQLIKRLELKGQTVAHSLKLIRFLWDQIMKISAPVAQLDMDKQSIFNPRPLALEKFLLINKDNLWVRHIFKFENVAKIILNMPKQKEFFRSIINLLSLFRPLEFEKKIEIKSSSCLNFFCAEPTSLVLEDEVPLSILENEFSMINPSVFQGLFSEATLEEQLLFFSCIEGQNDEILYHILQQIPNTITTLGLQNSKLAYLMQMHLLFDGDIVNSREVFPNLESLQILSSVPTRTHFNEGCLVSLITKFPRLKALTLQLNEHFSLKTIESIASLQLLTHLSVDGLELSNKDIEMLIRGRKDLISLNLASSTPNDETVAFIAKSCPRLNSLIFGDCRQLSDNSLIILKERCPVLEQLTLPNCCNFTNQAFISRIRYQFDLKQFKISHCSSLLMEIFASIAEHNYPRLEDLTIDQCHMIDFVFFSILKNNPTLKHFSFHMRDGDSLKEESYMKLLRCCRNLESLTLSGCCISLHFIQSLREKCLKLSQINFSNCQISEEAVIQLLEGNINLYCLDLSGTQVSEAVLLQVKQLPLQLVFKSDASLKLVESHTLFSDNFYQFMQNPQDEIKEIEQNIVVIEKELESLEVESCAKHFCVLL